jgi:hypothetical protein
MKKSVSIVCMCIALFLVSSGIVIALDPSTPPGKNFDLSAFKLQTLDDGKNFKEISPSLLSSGYTSQYFYTDKNDGSAVFAVPSDGATTKGTHYARTELRQTGHDADWRLTDAKLHYLRVKCAVLIVAEAKPQTIIGQIHGSQKDSELLKIRWTGYKPGKCFVEARLQKNNKSRDEYGAVLAEGLSLGDVIEYTVTMQNGIITVTIGSRSASQTLTAEFYGTSDSYYFKAGNYFQYNGRPAVIGVNKIYSITLNAPQ